MSESSSGSRRGPSRRRRGSRSRRGSRGERPSKEGFSESGGAGRERGKPKRPLEDFEPVEAFQGGNVFGLLLPAIGQAVADAGYLNPTPVQEQCIPPLLEGRDILGSAQTGTGKTAAFTLPLLQYLALNPGSYERNCPRVLILAPTRELAAQIDESIKEYGTHLSIRSTVIFGGVSQRPQEQRMSQGVDFLVATPGRLLDLMQQGYVDLSRVEAFVLDEADRMLDMGFVRDVRKIIEDVPEERHSLFFSATMSPTIISLANTMLKDPVRITIEPETPTVEKIQQSLRFVDATDKDALLVDLMSDPAMNKVIIFTQMKHMANKVVEKLGNAGIVAAAIHGNKSQGARTNALEGFRAGRVRALVATDIAARGIDVDGVTHVVNYHMPVEPETYVHRIGRTARAGTDGIAITFCEARERQQLNDVERLIRKQIPVVEDHPWHSPRARDARGADAKPLPKGGGRGRGGGGGRGGRGGQGGGRGRSQRSRR